MEFHPVASMFPLMEGAEFDALVADIAEHGQLEPIWLYEGKVLDGRNRWRACQQLGIEPRVQQWANGRDPEAFVVSLNLHRRHLTRDQRDALICDLRRKGLTLQKIADAVGVNVATAQRATQGVELLQMQKVEGADGKQYPTHYAPRETLEPPPMPHVSYNSGNNEWYTPPEYIAAACEVMGGIDLDPASSEIANRIVGAGTFYTAEDDGLAKAWSGRVWMNPPYASELIGAFTGKLAGSVRAGAVPTAIVLVNNATETGWFGDVIGVASAVCFPRSRVRFWQPDGRTSAPLQGQAIIYIGPEPERFREVFGAFGWTASL